VAQDLMRVEHGAQRLALALGADVHDVQREEFRPRPAVVVDGRLVHRQEAERLDIVHPHRQRAALEQLLVARRGRLGVGLRVLQLARQAHHFAHAALGQAAAPNQVRRDRHGGERGHGEDEVEGGHQGTA
jgi:hypothetical protein